MIIRVREMILLFFTSLPGLPNITIAPSVASKTVYIKMGSQRCEKQYVEPAGHTHVAINNAVATCETYTICSRIAPPGTLFLRAIVVFVPFFAGRTLRGSLLLAERSIDGCTRITDNFVVFNGSMTALLVVPFPEMKSTPAAESFMMRGYQIFVPRE